MDEIKRMRHTVKEVDEALDSMPSISDIYNKSETDALLKSKVNVEEFSAVQDRIAENACTLGYTRKNALKVTASTTTVNGVTMTVNSDGTLSLSGTATAQAVIPITPLTGRFPISDLPTNLILSGGNEMKGVELCIGVELSTDSNSGYVASFYDGDNGRTISLSDYPTAKYWRAYIRIYEGVNVDGITIYPMIRDVSVKNADYEPYAPSVLDYIKKLEDRVAALEGGAQASVLDTYEIKNEDDC